LTEAKKEKINDGIELMRKGATLLREACPKCGGLQVRYKNRTLCLKCDDLSDTSAIEISTMNELTTDLGELVLSKVQRLSDALRREEDLDKQARIANLILLYMDIMEKTKKSK